MKVGSPLFSKSVVPVVTDENVKNKWNVRFYDIELYKHPEKLTILFWYKRSKFRIITMTMQFLYLFWFLEPHDNITRLWSLYIHIIFIFHNLPYVLNSVVSSLMILRTFCVSRISDERLLHWRVIALTMGHSDLSESFE